MARGIAWVGIGPPVRQLMEPYVKAGVKADVRPLGNTPETATSSFGGSTLNVFNKRPHPNATRLFVNWILSKDVQTRFAQGIELNSRRRDVASVLPPDQTPIPGAKYEVPGRESYEREIAEGLELIKQYRQAPK
jgi:ABC-type Fe3+ transport system substrate-binding protein